MTPVLRYPYYMDIDEVITNCLAAHAVLGSRYDTSFSLFSGMISDTADLDA